MQARQIRSVNPQRLTLDQELSLWSKKGYRVLSRSTSTAQLGKRVESYILPLVSVWLVLCLVAWKVMLALTFTEATVFFLIGCALLAAWHAGRGEQLVYLAVTPDGEITQD